MRCNGNGTKEGLRGKSDVSIAEQYPMYFHNMLSSMTEVEYKGSGTRTSLVCFPI